MPSSPSRPAERPSLLLKVLAGTITPGIELTNARTRKTERLGHLYQMCGKETTDVQSAAAGDIVVVPKLEAMTGDTLSVTGRSRPPSSAPQLALPHRIEPDARGTEGKLYAFLEKSADADPTLKVERDEDTGQTVISAIGEAQVSVLLDRLEDRAGITAHTVALKIPYRETIRRVASAQGRHKKQTGGAGQYGDCWLRIEPNPGGGYEFADEVVGGHIPRGFIPAIDKGVQEDHARGRARRLPDDRRQGRRLRGLLPPRRLQRDGVQDRRAHRLPEGVDQAEPVLLEPMAHLRITVPESYAGSVMGDVSASRGRVEGMEAGTGATAGETTVVATIPYAEVTDYATRLRSALPRHRRVRARGLRLRAGPARHPAEARGRVCRPPRRGEK